MRHNYNLSIDLSNAYRIMSGKETDCPDCLEDLLDRVKERLNKITSEDIIEFGFYTLPNLDQPRECIVKKYITWNILKREEDKLLLLSEFCVDEGPFSPNVLYSTLILGTTPDDITNQWKDSYIRNHLNNTLFKEWFSAEERSIIAEKVIYANKGIHIEEATTDKVFLPAEDDFPEAFDLRAQMILAEKQDEEINLYWVDSEWWLRTPCDDSKNVLRVHKDGFIIEGSADAEMIGIRPCLWLDINAIDSLKRFVV